MPFLMQPPLEDWDNFWLREANYNNI